MLEGAVAETRRNDGFSSGLQVELKVVGDPLKDAKGIRVTLDKAVDETGKNLLDQKKAEKDFKSLSLQSDNSTKLSLLLLPSERKGTVIREISGYLDIFLPTKDARSVITVANVLRGAGKPVADSQLVPMLSPGAGRVARHELVGRASGFRQTSPKYLFRNRRTCAFRRKASARRFGARRPHE